MIDTSEYETSVFITELSENKQIHTIEFKNKNGETVSKYKYKIRKSKNTGEIQK